MKNLGYRTLTPDNEPADAESKTPFFQRKQHKAAQKKTHQKRRKSKPRQKEQRKQTMRDDQSPFAVLRNLKVK